MNYIWYGVFISIGVAAARIVGLTTTDGLILGVGAYIAMRLDGLEADDVGE